MRKSIYAITAVLLLLAAVGCDTTTGSGTEPGTGQVQDGLAVVSLSIAGTGSRTVLPAQAKLTDAAKWRLLGGKTGETRKPLTALFSDPDSQTLHLATGDWDFTLEGYADESGETLILGETIRGRRITLEGPNTLSFVVEPVLDGTGDIDITIELPAGHGITRVEVFKDGTDLESPIEPEGNNVVFKQEDHEAGDYYYSFRLYKETELYGVVSELVQVRLNLSSKAAPKLGPEDLNLSYVIEYHLNVNKPDPDYYRRTDAALVLPEPDEREGYEFDGWYTDNNLSEGPVAELPTPVTGGNRDFYAQWEIINYDINYVLGDEGSDNGGNLSSYNVESPEITLKDPTPNGKFRFLYWHVEGSPENAVTKIPANSTGHKTFYAKWIPRHTLTIDPHNDSGQVSTTHDEGYEVPKPPDPEWGKSQFIGWFNAASKGTKYGDDFWPHILTGDLTIHAQWTHPVTFAPNGGSSTGGSAALNPKSVLDGEQVAEPPGMTRSAEGLYLCAFEDIEDFTVDFGGWYDNPDFQNDPWDFSDPVARPLDLYANWVWSKPIVDISGQTGNNTLEKALNYIKENPPGVSTDYTIVLDGNISMASTASANITNANAVITLAGKKATTISLASNGDLFNIDAGELVLDNNITLQGLGSNTSSLIWVHGAFATLTMKDGAAIKGNKRPGDGGGVYVGDSGKFLMKGGTISGNSVSLQSYNAHGGGVYVNGGRFEMSGGEISGNDSRLDGGGVYVIGSSSIFEMSNGKISGSNSAQYGGGVYVAGGSFGMSGGIISGNSAKLITGYDSSGAGVYVNGGIFEMSNGEISGNSARVNGGGVGVSGSGSNFEMSGGIISDNSAEYGGGVHVRESGAFSKTGTSIIYGDTNTNHAWGSNENTATKSGGNYGHAVYRDNGNYRNSDLPSGVDLSTGSGTNWNQ